MLATVGLIAQAKKASSSAISKKPTVFEDRKFSRNSGGIKLNNANLAGVTAGSFQFSNGLDRVETIRSDGLIDGLDETEATCTGDVTLRFSTDKTVRNAIAAETPVRLTYKFEIPNTAHYLEVDMPRVFLPAQKNAISGPGGIEATYSFQAAYDKTSKSMVTVTLKNDKASY